MSFGSTGFSSGSKIPSGYKEGRVQNFSPDQMKLFKQLFSQVDPNSFLARLAGGDQSMFEEMEAPAWRQFAEMQDDLANRFSGMGMGARRGSGFQNTMNQAGSDFMQDLQSKRMELRRQALMDLMGISESLLAQKPYENFFIKKQQKKSPWGSLLGTGLGALGGSFFGNPMAGAKLGFNVGSAF